MRKVPGDLIRPARYIYIIMFAKSSHSVRAAWA